MNSTKVYVGMSGGVDSSLAAVLLLEQGYDVTGVYMKNWTQDLPGMVCPWADDLADAKRVAVQLSIPFKVYDFQKEYKQKVVDYMIEQYKRGQTPNPDIMCNQEVKFKLFLETALTDGADMIATGHYARVDYLTKASPIPFAKTRSTASVNNLVSLNRKGSVSAKGIGEAPHSLLLRARDELKDQTYFLYRITGTALAKTLFPIGEIASKAEVRKLAKKFGLATAEKKDSQGICFVGKVGIREFLSQYVQTKPGDIIDQPTGKVLGRHDGAIFFTLGQRHGLDVGGGLPLYVVGKDMKKNEVYVTTDLADQSLWRTTLNLSDIHWINQFSLQGQSLQVRLRHRAPLVDCAFKGKTLTLATPQRAIATGQSAVFYNKAQCLGGGIII